MVLQALLGEKNEHGFVGDPQLCPKMKGVRHQSIAIMDSVFLRIERMNLFLSEQMQKLVKT